MDKAIFKYKKDDGSITDREILNPSFVKEATNYLKDYNKDNVKYLQGVEFDKTNLTPELIKQYEEMIEDFYELNIQTFFEQNGLDPKRIQQKTFKKENIEGLNVING